MCQYYNIATCCVLCSRYHFLSWFVPVSTNQSCRKWSLHYHGCCVRWHRRLWLRRWRTWLRWVDNNGNEFDRWQVCHKIIDTSIYCSSSLSLQTHIINHDLWDIIIHKCYLIQGLELSGKQWLYLPKVKICIYDGTLQCFSCFSWILFIMIIRHKRFLIPIKWLKHDYFSLRFQEMSIGLRLLLRWSLFLSSLQGSMESYDVVYCG